MRPTSTMICPFCNVSLKHSSDTDRNFCNNVKVDGSSHYQEISNEKFEIYSIIILYDNWLMEVSSNSTLLRKLPNKEMFRNRLAITPTEDDYFLNFKIEIGTDYNQLLNKINKMSDLYCLA